MWLHWGLMQRELAVGIGGLVLQFMQKYTFLYLLLSTAGVL